MAASVTQTTFTASLHRRVSLRVYPDRLVVTAEGNILCYHTRAIERSHALPARAIHDWRHTGSHAKEAGSDSQRRIPPGIGEGQRERDAEGVEPPSAILAARLLILTGCRPNEMLSFRDRATRCCRRQDVCFDQSRSSPALPSRQRETHRRVTAQRSVASKSGPFRTLANRRL